MAGTDVELKKRRPPPVPWMRWSTPIGSHGDTETWSHREGRFPVGENHANPTTLTALMEHHEGHEEHEAIRELTGQALQKSSTAGSGVTLSWGVWHRTAAALRVSVAP